MAILPRILGCVARSRNVVALRRRIFSQLAIRTYGDLITLKQQLIFYPTPSKNLNSDVHVADFAATVAIQYKFGIQLYLHHLAKLIDAGLEQ
jgi:hypothetical protein